MDSSFANMRDVDRQLYGKNANRVMKTDVREHDEGYDVEIDLPGFKKDEIEVQLENGYLTIRTSRASLRTACSRSTFRRLNRGSPRKRTFSLRDKIPKGGPAGRTAKI